MEDYNVFREVRTDAGNFVDLLVSGSGEDENNAVVIENKINHHLHNDLSDYWNSAPGDDDSKVGILLTLNAHHIPGDVKGKFVNVRHRDWIDAVIQASSNYQLNTEQQVLLSNFHHAIINLSQNLTMNEQVLFFLNNIKAVNDIAQTRHQAWLHVTSQINSAAAQLGYSVGGTRSEHYRTLHIPKVDGVYYTILFHTLLEESQHISIILEINGKVAQMVDQLDAELMSDLEAVKDKGLEHRCYREGGWIHYLTLTSTIDRQTMANLAEYIATKIQDDFSDFTQKAVKAINGKILTQV